MSNRCTALQAWLAISTATALGMPLIQKCVEEAPAVVRDVEGLVDSQVRLNNSVNARKAMIQAQAASAPKIVESDS